MDSPLKKNAEHFCGGNRSPSLSRSPTIKSGISKLSELAELESGAGMQGKRLSTFSLEKQSKTLIGETLECILYQIFQLRVLLRPFLLGCIPFLWRYLRAGSAHNWIWSSGKASLTTCFTTLTFSIIFLVCALILLQYFILGLKVESLGNLRTKLMLALGCSSSKISSQFISLLTHKLFIGYSKIQSSVIWTIGSSPNHKRNFFGERVQRYANGDMYEGEFYEGKGSGSGVYTFHMGGKYEGEWVDGEFDGHGVETWVDVGSRYRGQYKHGLRNGYGVYRFQNGDEYSGEWANGQSHGYGVQKCGDGSKYIGQFKGGMKHGFGFYHYRNGDTYAGDYFEDKFQGYGVYRFAHGHVYEGAWHDGRKEGLGAYTFKNGDSHAGLWNCDAFQLPSFTNTSLKYSSAVNHTKVLHAIQEARKAASKALEIPRVGDRVNKAAGAANRAANAARVASIKAAQKNQDITLSIPDV